MGFEGIKICSTRRFAKSALAAALGLSFATAHADAVPRGKIRLELSGEISSREEQPAETTDNRVVLNGLIQSHPDPLYVTLEARYQALPPFTQAREDVPEEYIAEASTQEKFRQRMKELAGNASTFMPTIRTSLRYEDIQNVTGDDPADNQDYSTMLAIVNPTFHYEHGNRKWHLKASYDYEHGEYFLDRRTDKNNHEINVNWKLRLDRGKEFAISSLLQDSNDRDTRDPIKDFDSTLLSDSLDYNRYMVNMQYQNGTKRDRTRYNVYYVNEKSELRADDYLGDGYQLFRSGIGGSYVWQVRRQLGLVAEAKYNRFDYDMDFRDNNQYRALVGTDVILGRRIRAKLRVGYEQKSFDKSANGSTFGKPVWQGSLEWALRRKSSVRVETGREIFELATVNTPVDTEKFNVQEWIRAVWRERWTDKLLTETSYTYRDTSFRGRNEQESGEQFLISAVYQVSSKLKLAFDGGYTREDSSFGTNLKRRTFTFRTDYSL